MPKKNNAGTWENWPTEICTQQVIVDMDNDDDVLNGQSKTRVTISFPSRAVSITTLDINQKCTSHAHTVENGEHIIQKICREYPHIAKTIEEHCQPPTCAIDSITVQVTIPATPTTVWQCCKKYLKAMATYGYLSIFALLLYLILS